MASLYYYIVLIICLCIFYAYIININKYFILMKIITNLQLKYIKIYKIIIIIGEKRINQMFNPVINKLLFLYEYVYNFCIG